MSSLETEIQPQMSFIRRKPIVLLVGLIIISLGSLVVCVVASPWSESRNAALVILLLSAVPLVYLMVLSFRIFRTHRQIQEAFDLERSRIMHANFASLSNGLRLEMLNARDVSIFIRDGDRANAIDKSQIPEPFLGSNLIRTMEGYVLQRYVAGEELVLDELGKSLNEAMLDRVQPLQRDQEQAFLIGLAGTVLGLVVQISLTQSSVLSQVFLTGVVVKACCTFCGILVALYAKSLRQELIDKYSSLIKRLVQFASFYIAPFFSQLSNDPVALGQVLQASILELKNSVESVKTSLSQALAIAVDTASKELGKRLKETFATELAQAIKEQITHPFHADVDGLRRSISQSGDSIAEGVRGLKDGTREFKQEFSTLARASSNMGNQLTDAGNVLNSLAHKFEEIVGQADQVAKTLKNAQGELELAIKRSQTNHSDQDGSWKKGEFEELMKDIREDRRIHVQMINRLAGDLSNPKRNG